MAALGDQKSLVTGSTEKDGRQLHRRANKPAILDSYKGFLNAQSNLAAVNKDPQANKDTVFAAIDAVNQARAALQKATSAMLLQIRKEMDPDQVSKLEKVE